MICRHLLLANRSRRSKWKSGNFFGWTSRGQVLEIVYGRACNGLTLNRWDGRPKLELEAKWIWQPNRDGNMFHTCTGLTAWYQLADVDIVSERTTRRRNTYELSCGNFVLKHLFGRRQLQYSNGVRSPRQCSRSDLAYRPSATQKANNYDGVHWGSLQIQNEIFSSGWGFGDHTDQTHATPIRADVDKLRRNFHPFKCQFEECEWHLAAMNCTISYTRNTNVTLCGDKKKLYLKWKNKDNRSQAQKNTATF